nr:hypothetical protein [Pseudopedobacter sp.]
MKSKGNHFSEATVLPTAHTSQGIIQMAGIRSCQVYLTWDNAMLKMVNMRFLNRN